MRLLGVDPFAEPPFRSYLGPGDQSQAPAAGFLRDLMVTPNTALAEHGGCRTVWAGSGRHAHHPQRHRQADHSPLPGCCSLPTTSAGARWTG